MSDSEDATAPDIRIVSGRPTPEEVAAVTAVLTAALSQLAQQDRREQRTAPSGWDRSRRALRAPLTTGAWRSFGR